jgi:hypothetical protein
MLMVSISVAAADSNNTTSTATSSTKIQSRRSAPSSSHYYWVFRILQSFSVLLIAAATVLSVFFPDVRLPPETVVFGHDGTLYVMTELVGRIVRGEDMQSAVAAAAATVIRNATATVVRDLGPGRPLGGKIVPRGAPNPFSTISINNDSNHNKNGGKNKRIKRPNSNSILQWKHCTLRTLCWDSHALPT